MCVNVAMITVRVLLPALPLANMAKKKKDLHVIFDTRRKKAFLL